jgi:putative flippase GtrA
MRANSAMKIRPSATGNASVLCNAASVSAKLTAAASSRTEHEMHTLLLRLATQLPPPVRFIATPRRIRTLVQFLMFGTVGTLGFMVDTATVYALRGSIGLYGAGMAAYLAGATTTWLFNRLWTFRGLGRGGAVHRQWAKFLVVNLAGFVLNRGTYALLVTFVPLCAEQPVFATAAGAIAGMFVNFSLSRSMVFR